MGTLRAVAIGFVVAVHLCVPGPSIAQNKDWHIGLWLGRASVDLGDVEKDVQNTVVSEGEEFIFLFGGAALWQRTDVKAGTLVGGEVSYEVSPNIGIGLKAGVIMLADITGEVDGVGALGETMTESTKISLTLVPVLVGAWARGGHDVGFHYQGSLFLGPALASGDNQISFSLVVPWWPALNTSYSSIVPMHGNAFAVEGETRAGYGLSESVALFASVSYMVANVKKMKVTSPVDIDRDGTIDVLSGETYGDANNQAVPFDFSGLSLRAGIDIAL